MPIKRGPVLLIKRVEIKDGYKRFHHLTIDLGQSPKRIIALVGPNGCGKSSVLDALLYRYTNQQRMIGRQGRPTEYHSMTGGAYAAASSIVVDFDKGTFNDVVGQKHALSPEKHNTLFSFRSCYRYNSQVKISETRAVPAIGANEYGASVTADLDQKMEDNYRRLLGAFNKYLRESNSTFQDAAAHIIGEINNSLNRCLDLEIDHLGIVENNQGTLYFKKADHPSPIEFNYLSAGEKEAVDIIVDLYLRKPDYDDTIFLIDEPELHINTAIQRKLLKEIDSLIGPNCQIWLATHSIGFLRALQEDLRDKSQIIYFPPNKRYAAERIDLVPLKPSPAVWQTIFSTALDDLTELLSPQRLIYCEGRDVPGSGGRELGLDARVYNLVFGELQDQTLFVSSGGNTELDQRRSIALRVLSKALPKLEIWVLKDRDIGSGKSISEAERQDALSKGDASLRILLRWEIENYLFDKELLIAYCTKHGRSFDETAYDALIPNIADDDVKMHANAIKVLCGVDINYGTDAFKLDLAALITPATSVYKALESCIFERA
ncbi:AAA family ATPase [Hyphomicrobium sp. MC1]|uniref:AAA family ATPase n=1 Tax=Hyphomicrobium sp. (strain MC1) TaxID=717785 RepID=UPI001FCCACBF|nr:AAA family ATPase [Hyphomicrobium sp. MC1]